MTHFVELFNSIEVTNFEMYIAEYVIDIASLGSCKIVMVWVIFSNVYNV